MTDIDQRQRSGTRRRGADFQRFIVRLSTHFSRLAPGEAATPEKVDATISVALAELGRFLGANRAYLLEMSEDGTSLSVNHQWRDAKVGLGLEVITEAAFPWLWSQIQGRKAVQVSRASDLPPEAVREIEGFARIFTESTIQLPMVSDGKLNGVLGLDWVDSRREPATTIDRSQLGLIQVLFANALRHKRTEEAFNKANRLLGAVLECSDALIRAQDEGVLLDEVCRIIVEVGGFRMAWVAFGVADEAHSIKPVAKWGHDEGYLDRIEITWADIESGRGPMGRTIRTRLPAAVQSVATDPDFEPWRDGALERGYKSVLAVSLVFGDELLGALGVYASEPGAFDALEVEILQQFADYLSYGIVALRTRAKREVAEERLRNSLRSKDQLIASISHELRTPLTAVVGFAQMLRDQGSLLSAKDREDMTRSIIEQGLDLTNIVEDLLTAAKAEAGTLTVVRVSVDLRAQAVQVVEMLNQPEAQHKVLTTAPSAAMGDPGRVRQILRNLISNAFKYGGGSIRIGTINDSMSRVYVADDGPGIPEDERERVFESYQRAHSDPGLTASVGLGLTISRTLARLMGGDLTYRHSAGESIFELALPRPDAPWSRSISTS